MSAWIVPRRFGTTSGPKRLFAAAMYIAMMIGAGPLIVIDAEKSGRAEVEAVVEPDHVLDGVDRDAALADLPEHAVGVAVQAVQRRPVERGAQPRAALVAGEVMEAFVRVLGQTKAGKEASGFFRLFHLLVRCGVAVLPVFRVAVLSVGAVLLAVAATFGLAQRLQIHLAIRAVREWEFARQSFA